MQVPRGDVMEQGEGHGDPAVESGGGDSDLADRSAAGSARGAGVRHVGDALQRQEAARVSAASRADH